MDTFDFAGVELGRWKVGPSTFTARPELGARLMSWDIEVAGNKRSIIHWPWEKEDLSEFHRIRGGNPILFPFSARTYEGGELGFWKAKDGVRRPMPMHGFARNGQFELTESSETGFRVSLRPDEAAAEAYPYDYDFEVSYVFEELALTVTFTLENRGEEPLPWSAGHHFYFRLPWHEGARREDYRIEIPAKKAWRHASDGRLVPTDCPKEAVRFSDPELVDRIHTQLQDGRICFGPAGGEEDVAISFGDGLRPDSWATLVTWTQDEESPYYCVEPWMGPPNGPGHGKGLHEVGPGTSESFAVRVALQ